MADGPSNSNHHQRRYPRVRPFARFAAVAATMTVGVAACGGETEPGLGTGTVPVTIATTTSTTDPPPTTTTIDFNREIVQETDPIPADAVIAEFAEAVEDMRGQTNNVSQQLARLVSFPALNSPSGSQILDFSVGTETIEDGFEISSSVLFRVPQEPEQLVEFTEGEMKARGWNKANEREGSEDGRALTGLTFQIPGTPGDITQLEVLITGFEGYSTMQYNYRSVAEEGDVSFDRLRVWQSTLRVPRSTVAIGAKIETVDNTGSMTVRYQLEAETAAEAREDIRDLVREDEFILATSDESGPTAAPLLMTDENGEQLLLEFFLTRDPEIIEMTISNSFPIDPVDP